MHARARVGAAGDGGGVLNVVALHGVSSPDGSEVEILASTNPGLSQAALNLIGPRTGK